MADLKIINYCNKFDTLFKLRVQVKYTTRLCHIRERQFHKLEYLYEPLCLCTVGVEGVCVLETRN